MNSNKYVTQITLHIMLFTLCILAAGIKADPENEIVAKFADSLIVMPFGQQTSGKEAINNPADPKGELLVNSALSEIRVAFPNYDHSDSIRINQWGDTILRPRLNDYYLLCFPDSLARNQIYDSLSNMDNIISLSKNIMLTADVDIVPNDPKYYLQWNLHADSIHNGFPYRGIDVAGAWEYAWGDNNIIVSIIDEYSVSHDHIELSPKVFGDNVNVGNHSTVAAAIIGANTDNGVLIAGICPDVSIYSAYAEGFIATNVASKVIQSVDIGASILNNSFGTSTYISYLRSAYAYAYKMNRISVCSKGNDGNNNYHYPSDFGQGIISVGAAMPNGSYYNESNWGNGIDVIAPGVGIRSIIYNSEISTNQYTGTSFAAPHVAGLAALLLGYDNTLYNDDIENIINLSATDEYRPPAAEGYDDHTGYGIINARTAFGILQPPNSLKHYEKYGGFEYSATGYDPVVLRDIADLPWDTYLAKMVEVRKWVNFDKPYYEIPYVWGTGVRAIGFSAENPNYGMGYTEVIPGTVTTTGCQVCTYIYDVKTTSGRDIGWFPCNVNGVRFAYSVLGEEELLPADYIYCSLSDNDQAIQISIEDLNDFEQGWIIERKDATNQTWAVIDTIPNNPNEFVFHEDFYPVGSETYTYRAKPYSENQTNVAYSSEFGITARPNRPENVDAFTTDYGGIVPLGGMMCGFGLESIPEFPDTLEEPLPHLYGNDITVIWSPPQNQKLPIVSYVVKRRPGVSPPNYVENVGLDTIFYKCPNSYNTGYTMEVYAIDSNGDTSLCASDGVQTGTTNTCPGTPTKESDYVADMVPLEFELQQNYPNPFNLNTTIAFSLPAESNVKLEIFDILGRKIKTLINENFVQGAHSIDWDGRDYTGRIVSSGVYFCRIESACGIKTLKMLLIK